MKVFLEIGYTNSKFYLDNSEELTVVANSSFDLEDYLHHFDFVNNKLYVLNNNNKLNSLLMSFKNQTNYFLFDHYVHHLALKINPNINQDELGDDLRFLIYYLGEHNAQDIALMSDGSCLVTIVKQDDVINSVSINLGLKTSLDVIHRNYGLTTNRMFFNSYGTNTNDALALGEYLMFKGVLTTTLENFNLKECLIILCGNGFNENWINQFQDTTKLKLNYIPDLVIRTFRAWCLKSLSN